MNDERQDGGAASRLVAASHRFRHGFSQLGIAFQAIHRDPFAWKRYLRVTTVQALVILAATGISLSTAKRSSDEFRQERVRKALKQVNAVDRAAAPAPPAAVRAAHPPRRTPDARPTGSAKGVTAPPARPAAPAATPAEKPDDEDDPDVDSEEAPTSARTPGPTLRRDDADPPETEQDFRDSVHEFQAAMVDLAKEAAGKSARGSKDFQEARGELDRQLTTLQAAADKLPLTAEDKAALVRLGAEMDVLEEKTRPGFWDSALALILSIYGTLSVVQAVVIALSRDYHASIARDASLLLGVAPEDPPMVPRVRVNVAWIRRKLKQRTRTLLVFLPGLGLIWLASMPFPRRATVTSVLTTAWAAYWWVVWTASKSARAWERTTLARPPWFLRLWHDRLAPLPLVGRIARSLEGIWMRLTRPVFSPAEAVEAQPLEFAGLAAARALQLVPVLKLFVRPLVPVAAARLIAERAPRADLLLGSTAERESLAAHRAAVPASPDALRARDVM